MTNSDTVQICAVEQYYYKLAEPY